MKRITFLAAFLILLATAIYSIARQSAQSFVPVTDVMLENPDPADWLMWRRTLNDRRLDLGIQTTVVGGRREDFAHRAEYQPEYCNLREQYHRHER